MYEAAHGELRHYMDRSNFPKDHEYFNNDCKGELGLLKSETAEKRIAGVIALQPKCYCLKLEGDSTKLAAKGVPNQHQRLLRYENYDEIYKGIKSSHDVVVTNIVSKKCSPSYTTY